MDAVVVGAPLDPLTLNKIESISRCNCQLKYHSSHEYQTFIFIRASEP